MTSARGRTIRRLAVMIAVLAATTCCADESSPAPRFADGGKLFQENCAVCHRADGAGQPGLAPPLTKYPARYLVSAAGRRQLAITVLFGMFGDIAVDERHYNFKMPDFSRFDDASLAAVLNFVAFDLARATATDSPLTAADVTRERGAALSGDAVRHHRFEVIAGFAP